MQTVDEIRLERLQLLIKEHETQAALARKIDKSPAQISQWINRSPDSKTGKPRVMDRGTARTIESACGKPVGWMDQPIDAGSQHPPSSNPHGEISVKKSRNLIDLKNNLSFTLLPVVQFQGLDMSQKNDALIGGQEWISTPGQFSERAKITKMPDNSMFPEIYPGEYIAFDPGIPADAGDTVLIKDEHGGFWIRKYRPLPGGRFDAVAANDDHAPLRSSEGGLQVLAVLVGHWRGRRARSH